MAAVEEDDLLHPVSDADYRRLLELRTRLRRFLHWSDGRARSAGITPTQHQALLAIRGHPGPEAPTVGELAAHLLLRHHSTVQLVDRAEAAGLVQRARDATDHRVVRVALTSDGAQVLASLSAPHREELRRIGESFLGL
jgi:DNA-binding MarR family transcriptional regulator